MNDTLLGFCFFSRQFGKLLLFVGTINCRFSYFDIESTNTV